MTAMSVASRLAFASRTILATHTSDITVSATGDGGRNRRRVPVNAIPGAAVEGFRDSWDAIISTWKTHEGAPPGNEDALHVETHILEGRDVFVTDDRGLRAMCRRLDFEYSLPVVARSLEEYFEDRSGVELASDAESG